MPRLGQRVEPYGTKKVIIDLLFNHALMKEEELIAETCKRAKVTVDNVKKRLNDLKISGAVKEKYGYVWLNEVPYPLTSWRLTGVPISMAFLYISLFWNNIPFIIASLAFTFYAITVNIEDMIRYWNHKIKSPILRKIIAKT